jgi:hypothetical protein
MSESQGNPPDYWEDLPDWLKKLFVAMGMGTESWLDAPSQFDPSWAEPFRFGRALAFLSPLGLGPQYAYGAFETSVRAGYFGAPPGTPEGFAYAARQQMALSAATQYDQRIPYAQSLTPYQQALGVTAVTYGGYLSAMQQLNYGAAAYWGTQQELAPLSIAWSGARLASYMMPGMGIIRAFGFPFYGAYRTLTTARAQTPYVQAAMEAYPGITPMITGFGVPQGLQARPTFSAFQLQPLGEALMSGYGSWTLAQAGFWGFQAGVANVLGGESFLGGFFGSIKSTMGWNLIQAGLGLGMETWATQEAWRMAEIPITPEMQQQLNIRYAISGGTVIGGLGYQAYMWTRPPPALSIFSMTRGQLGYAITGFAMPEDVNMQNVFPPGRGSDYAFAAPNLPLNPLGRGLTTLAGIVGYLGIETMVAALPNQMTRLGQTFQLTEQQQIVRQVGGTVLASLVGLLAQTGTQQLLSQSSLFTSPMGGLGAVEFPLAMVQLALMSAQGAENIMATQYIQSFGFMQRQPYWGQWGPAPFQPLTPEQASMIAASQRPAGFGPGSYYALAYPSIAQTPAQRVWSQLQPTPIAAAIRAPSAWQASLMMNYAMGGPTRLGAQGEPSEWQGWGTYLREVVGGQFGFGTGGMEDVIRFYAENPRAYTFPGGTTTMSLSDYAADWTGVYSGRQWWARPWNRWNPWRPWISTDVTFTAGLRGQLYGPGGGWQGKPTGWQSWDWQQKAAWIKAHPGLTTPSVGPPMVMPESVVPENPIVAAGGFWWTKEAEKRKRNLEEYQAQAYRSTKEAPSDTPSWEKLTRSVTLYQTTPPAAQDDSSRIEMVTRRVIRELTDSQVVLSGDAGRWSPFQSEEIVNQLSTPLAKRILDDVSRR